MGVIHRYISTACEHEEDSPELHAACRQTCKFCNAPCMCENHKDGDRQSAVGWVDQARAIARDLLRDALNGPVSPELLARIESDPTLFWLRGEEAPPGEWSNPWQK